MEKNKSEKSNPVNREDLILQNPNALPIWHTIQIMELAKRLSECILAIEKYGDIPKIEEEMESIIHQLRRNAQFKIRVRTSKSNNDRISLLEKQAPPKDILNSAFKDLGKTNICEKESLERCLIYCLNLGYLCDPDNFLLATTTERIKILMMENLVIKKSCETLGYWTAKLEMMKQNKANVKPRTTKKEKHKEELKEWMKTMSRKECRLKAQKEFDVTDRAVLNYLKEIKDEETAFLRKKGDTA